MITLLSSLLGFIGAAFPDFLKLFRDKADRIHELAILDKQMEMQARIGSEHLEEIRLGAEQTEEKALYATYATGISWVDALNGTVRPVLAYAFFLLYASVKLLQCSMIDGSGPSFVDILWQEEDRAIFAGIISFYFGQRALSKLRGK